MKNAIKKILINLGIIDYIRLAYNSCKTFTLRVLIDEIRFRKNGLPDGYPSPPPKLIFMIIALRWSHIYYYSGEQIYNNIILLLEKNRIDISSLKNILDFGCGCGRIIRHFYRNNRSLQLYGSDYNEDLVNWCSENLSFGKFNKNKITPPLLYEDELFQFIYARSVFTHLGLELQKLWIAEFKRTLQKEGYLYITTHGEFLFNKLDITSRNKILKEGFIVINDEIEGDNKCTTFQTYDFVINNLLDGFELIDFIPGSSENNSPQDIYLLKKV